MKGLWEIAEFIRGVRARMRFGELSRAPLRLLRLQVQGEATECDWMARPPDLWDSTLPQEVRDQNASLQALQDAMGVRELLFAAMREVRSAEFRAFRQSSAHEPPELIIFGTATREFPAVLRVTSPAMRAKLFGFHFCMEDGILTPLAIKKTQFGFGTDNE
jgi:hypothetical protein